jgi:hypothetical protein
VNVRLPPMASAACFLSVLWAAALFQTGCSDKGEEICKRHQSLCTTPSTQGSPGTVALLCDADSMSKSANEDEVNDCIQSAKTCTDANECLKKAKP